MDSEVVFNTGAHEEDHEDHEDHVDHEDQEKTPDSRTPPTLITQRDMDTIIRGWEEKFSKIVECLREVQLTSERASSDMCLVGQEARAQSQEHDRRLSDFLHKFDDIDALRASTPRRYPTFGYQTSPVVREEVSHPPSSLPHFESARTEEEEENSEPRNSLPHASSARTGEHLLFRNTRTRDHDADRDTRTKERDNSRNTLPHSSSARTGEHLFFQDTHTRDHDDDSGETCNRDRNDGRDTRTLQFRLDDNRRNPTDNHDNSTFSRQSSCPKVPMFDGSNTAQFRPWIIQFEAIARHQGWTAGERVVRLVSSLTGPAANLLIGMTLEQLDNYNCLRTRLSRRYDPPEREEAHRAELRARTRRRNETADEFAENIKNLAQRAYPLADQNMLDNLVVERFREGHGNEDLQKHLCLYPSNGLQDLIGACVRFETHVEIGAHARKSNEGLYAVQNTTKGELTLEEVTRAARRLGFGLRPWTVRQQNPRGFSNNSPAKNRNGGEQQQTPKIIPNGNNNARTQNTPRRQTPLGEVKCWTCGKNGHYAADCRSGGPKLAFALKALKMNFLQQLAEQVQEYSEIEQRPRSGNE